MNYWTSNLITSAQAQPTGTPAGKKPAGPGGSSMIFLLIGMFFLMYMIVLRPGKKQQATRERMLDAVKKGDRVITIGGMHGKVTDVDTVKKIITVEVAPKTEIKFNRSAIATVDARNENKEQS